MWWLVVGSPPPGHAGVEGVWVEAESEGEAAQDALDMLSAMRMDTAEPQDAEPVTNVYVITGPRSWTAYSSVMRAERSVLQCCGGLPPEYPERHHASCPEGTKDTSGWPMPGAGAE